MKIPFSPPDITDEEIKEVTEVLKSGWITTGPKTKELEEKIAGFCHTDRAVALNSATACMEMALRLFEIGPGDEVIVPAYTYTASASVVVHVGATLKLVDVGADSYNIDYDKLEELITDKTKAIIPVDIAGVMVDYDRIRDIVMDKRGLFKPQGKLQEALGHILILADSAHGFGASRKGKMSGEDADFTSFSFHAVKNFTTAEGGALVWRHIPGVDDEEIYHQLMLLTLHGQSKDALAKTKLGAWEYDIVGPYFKCNMTDIMAGIGLAQFRRYEGLLARRKEIIEKYTKGISGDNIQILAHYGSDFKSSGHLFLVRVLNMNEEDRNNLITEMAEKGIATNVHYKPLPMHTAYKNLGFDIKDFPNSYNMYHNEITLPLHTLLTDEQVDYVIETFNELVK
ncbi:MAG: DegT/DnrJ/EryC1/StrS family aminotransferase [Clostridia bacterium]|nr:DegT/DnrJ/EryC1/StrS family aminotransferase [Clostridia bacterium]